ncbi:hypothetical protein SCOR_29005 [Sulfidibacter corallicola]|uniref:Uncharacterized protein n=1 Tax=Sulfidibacter corallicola TaxID=2818388 RepID=A0A8A4TV47_SULCO|nr:hypothetical protein [Sulfidibacter corallicola]QTD50405.1 hypothetical protein J3U87_32880 [Sulfidibacter corallicola]
MGFLDDLDSAFDNIMLDDDEAAKTDAGAYNPSLSEMGLPAELKELKAAISGETLLPICGLLRNIDRCKRAYILAALKGSLNYHLAVESDAERRATAESMDRHLTTRRGTTRQVFRPGQKGEVLDLGKELGGPRAEAEGKRVREFLLDLQQCPLISPQDTEKLFKAGIWERESIRKGTMEGLITLSTLDQEQIQALKEIAAS